MNGALRIPWHYLLAKLHHSYPCRTCGYRYVCGDPPGSDCHS